MAEKMTTVDYNGNIEQSVFLEIKFWSILKDGTFEKDAMVQNYAQWTSPTETGKFGGVTCNAKYPGANGKATDITVTNYAGVDSLRNEDGGNQGGWVKDTGNLEYDLFMEEDDPEQQAAAYKSEYTKKSKSAQTCSVKALANFTENGEATATSEKINEFYWKLKNMESIKLWTGARVYNDPSGNPSYEVDAAEFTYEFYDFGLEDPNAGLKIPDDSEFEKEEEAGAVHLLSAATALAALLLM